MSVFVNAIHIPNITATLTLAADSLFNAFNQSIIYLIQATRPIKRTNIKRKRKKRKTDRQKEEDRDILH